MFDIHTQHHHTILLGDLNYRVTGSVTEVLGLIAESARQTQVCHHDQDRLCASIICLLVDLLIARLCQHALYFTHTQTMVLRQKDNNDAMATPPRPNKETTSITTSSSMDDGGRQPSVGSWRTISYSRLSEIPDRVMPPSLFLASSSSSSSCVAPPQRSRSFNSSLISDLETVCIYSSSSSSAFFLW